MSDKGGHRDRVMAGGYRKSIPFHFLPKNTH